MPVSILYGIYNNRGVIDEGRIKSKPSRILFIKLLHKYLKHINIWITWHWWKAIRFTDSLGRRQLEQGEEILGDCLWNNLVTRCWRSDYMGLKMSNIRYLVRKCADIDILCLNIDIDLGWIMQVNHMLGDNGEN